MPSTKEVPVGLGAVRAPQFPSSERPSKTARLDIDSAAVPANKAKNNGNTQQLSNKIPNLLAWIHRLEETKKAADGYNLSSTIRIAASPHGGGLGAFAANDVPPGGLIGRIPNAATMSVEKSATHSIVGKAIAAMKFREEELEEASKSTPCRPTNEFILWLDMCHGRRDENHPHHPYLASLPSKAPDVPSWSAEELLQLEGTNLGAAATRASQQRQQEYKTWMPQMQQQHPEIFGNGNIGKNGFRLQDIVWASGMYFSRRFPAVLLMNGKSGIDPKTTSTTKNISADAGIMLPVFDLLNHRPHQPITWSGSATHVSFSNSAVEAIPKGVELFNNYGPKGNDMLMMMYGFALTDNVHDSYGLHLVLMMQQKVGDEVVHVKKDLGTFQIHRHDSPMDEQFPPGLWRALNQMFVDAEGGDEVGDNNEDVNVNAPIEIGLEAIEFLLETLQRRLQPFLVSKEKDSTCQTDVDRYRNGQLIVLEQAIETLEQMIPPEDDEEEGEEEEDVGF